MSAEPRAVVDDTYAEAFRSLYSEFLITARDRAWLDHAIAACTGNASSTILCDCEAGLDRYVGPGGDESFATPDGRPGAIVQVHVPRFRKDRARALERALLVRISQNVLTCPTAACFNLLDADGKDIVYYYEAYVDGFDPPGQTSADIDCSVTNCRMSRAQEPRTLRVGVKFEF